ncbi:MAG: tRNA pseudouridine55 synthase [Candidatus Peregrinibacteria bacterium Greene0416_19]|nr:MAG: tRNA pseudouridine55 synthase [Candidatus Peregrinibacteria bacterium Greene0416_19]
MVALVRRTLGERSIGHLGTLDPAATGLLVLAIGRKALKVVELFRDLPKEYEAEVMLAAVSTTYDAEGTIEKLALKPGWEAPEQAVIQRLLADRFIGRIAQVPPAFSAVHVDGKRAYTLARQGAGVSLPPREVEIRRIDILAYTFPTLRLRIACGSGTYIRSIAHDLGKLLGCGGYLAGLCRTKVGDWSLADAVMRDHVTWACVRPLKDVLAPFPVRSLTAAEFDDVSHGRPIEAEVEANTIGWHDGLPVTLLEPAGEGMAKPRKVF